jgi:hypothetical protein
MNPIWFEGGVPIKQLAAAYNFGFWHPQEKIEEWMSARHFPASGKNAFSYATVAEEYYRIGNAGVTLNR